ncbi:DUF5107 domain-containing protein [Muricauda sp. 2012CJ35-5]|uniref:DUF5107 domain-containing protein n=1 Tax=Flagellimonas spongiicola TaxID=2942208 RepID=A0ABT0PQT5_9FLAO|nr:DUF5107 domain-containing protein [Allomuricauda spongiicola]MCL6273753.1 DUF5107 domain-containing protein [Allomuricauda spongiicola]
MRTLFRKPTDKSSTRLYGTLMLLFLIPCWLLSQSATITEEIRQLDTYGFDSPNPVPILNENPKIFPYFKYEGYSHTAQKKGWKVVKLENEFIEVYVLPEVGGKVWGAIEKSTGNEFLYRNEVVKFRNIAMRGPWTSGGIEFNFGIIGHHPSTATPVDYSTRKNDDGSVSCVVGNLDLPSRTYWQVEIKLEGDKAYFETNASWYNGTPLNQSYYNWMTGAAPTADDLEFFIPGNGFLEHDGTWRKWPIDDKGRNLAMYRNNNFGPAKSYHIVGDYQNYFGGYYHDRKVGFGHLSSYEEMPGQKLWLWALSRAGGIWEDLLTDTDGQYIEFQAGRLLNQYFPGAENPVSQANFDPYMMDSWNEIWFPIKEIGGMEAVSEYGVLNVERNGASATLGINALQAFDQPLQIFVNGEQVFFQENLQMNPMQVFEQSVDCKDDDTLAIYLGADKLVYTSEKKTILKKDFKYNPKVAASKIEKLYHEASEAMKYREYALAEEKLQELFKLDAFHARAHTLMAEAEYRKTRYSNALGHTAKALQLDIYDPKANYLSGLAYWAQNDAVNALEALGWAARSIQFRSAAYAVMAEIYMHGKNLEKAVEYAEKSLAFNTYNLNARQVLLVASRISQNVDEIRNQLRRIAEISPINHFANLEALKLEGKSTSQILQNVQNEFGNETILELAITYLNLGQEQMAEELLALNTDDSKSKLLLAYIMANTNSSKSEVLLQEVAAASPDFVFPYRREMVPAMEWAVNSNTNWRFKYFLAQNYMAVGLKDKALKLLVACGMESDNDAFYKFRAESTTMASYDAKLEDYQKAVSLNTGYWKNWDDLMRFYLSHYKMAEAVVLGKKATRKFPDNYNLGLSYAKALVGNRSYSKAINVLAELNILPFEHASESKRIYDQAHVFLAKELMGKNQFSKANTLLETSKAWTENLGVGAPYNPDTRMPDYLLGINNQKLGNNQEAQNYFKKVVDYDAAGTINLNTIFTLLSLDKLGATAKKEALLDKIEAATSTNTNAQNVLAMYQKDFQTAQSLVDAKKLDQRRLEIIKYAINN